MSTAEMLEQASALLSEWANETKPVEANRVDAVVDREHLAGAVNSLVQSRWGYLSAITGLDVGTDKDLEVLYHFCRGQAVVTLRVPVPKLDPRIDSISEIVRYAGLFELELAEMFGVHVSNIEAGAHLYLPENWPADTYPLRKDFKTTGVGEEKRTDG
ncbi:MAG: NADH-quinone oxidoreductase subunit C [Rudaea sp.]